MFRTAKVQNFFQSRNKNIAIFFEMLTFVFENDLTWTGN